MQFSALVVLLLFALVNVNAKGIPCKKYIITKEGERCNQISGFAEKKQYYLRMKDLLQYNPALDCENELEPGTIVCVEYDSDTPMDPPNKAYRIRRGDTCEKIARRLKTTPAVIQNYNPNDIRCDLVKKQVGHVIHYQKDGDYEPTITENSELVSIDGY